MLKSDNNMSGYNLNVLECNLVNVDLGMLILYS